MEAVALKHMSLVTPHPTRRTELLKRLRVQKECTCGSAARELREIRQQNTLVIVLIVPCFIPIELMKLSQPVVVRCCSRTSLHVPIHVPPKAMRSVASIPC